MDEDTLDQIMTQRIMNKNALGQQENVRSLLCFRPIRWGVVFTQDFRLLLKVESLQRSYAKTLCAIAIWRFLLDRSSTSLSDTTEVERVLC